MNINNIDVSQYMPNEEANSLVAKVSEKVTEAATFVDTMHALETVMQQESMWKVTKKRYQERDVEKNSDCGIADVYIGLKNQDGITIEGTIFRNEAEDGWYLPLFNRIGGDQDKFEIAVFAPQTGDAAIANPEKTQYLNGPRMVMKERGETSVDQIFDLVTGALTQVNVSTTGKDTYDNCVFSGEGQLRYRKYHAVHEGEEIFGEMVTDLGSGDELHWTTKMANVPLEARTVGFVNLSDGMLLQQPGSMLSSEKLTSVTAYINGEAVRCADFDERQKFMEGFFQAKKGYE